MDLNYDLLFWIVPNYLPMSYILYLLKFVVFFSIENQHIQFKVEPNARDIDASQVAQALGKNSVLLFFSWNNEILIF